jgi:DNA polymerase II small subunit
LDKREVVKYLLKKGFLVTEDILNNPNFIEELKKENPLSQEDIDFLGKYAAQTQLPVAQLPEIQKFELQPISKIDTSPINIQLSEPPFSDINLIPLVKSSIISPIINPITSSVKILYSYNDESKKRTCEDFISYFRSRFKAVRSLLESRQELQNLISIQKLSMKKEKEQVSLIGMVFDIQKTKLGNIMVTIEDSTGSIKCLISKDNPELLEASKELVLDEVIGISGFFNQRIVYVNSVIWPDVPLIKELKKAPDEAYAAFISDTEFGSKYFLQDKFDAFIKWLNGDFGTDDQKHAVSKLKYLFIVGDLVEGVGIYPGQENELLIHDIYDQYKKFAEYLKKIPQNITIIICPGNHDAMRLAEPQPPLYKDFAASVWEIPNVILVSNPALVNIHSSENFPGFDVLMYHGFSLVYYADNLEPVRVAGGQERSDLIMKYLLKKRHLAPTHSSALYLPLTTDPLFISKVPDFFVTGHTHQVSAASYRNITMLNCSCWIGQTPYQEKMGVNPKPARVLVANLQTREVKIMRF